MENVILPRSVKLVVIIHLCLVFTYASYLLLKPALDSWFAQKVELDLIESVMSEKDLYGAIASQDKTLIQNMLQNLGHSQKKSYFSSLFSLLSEKCSPFCLGWLFFSLASCLLLLFSLEGGKASAWLLPLIVLVYGISLVSNPHQEKKSSLFPEEQEVLQGYSDPAIDGAFSKKQKLERAWANYLVMNWTKEKPKKDLSLFREQLRRGIFAFNLERALRLHRGEEKIDTGTYFREKPSFLTWFFYFFWNTFFAYHVSRKYA